MNASPEVERLALALNNLAEAISSIIGRKIEDSLKIPPTNRPENRYEVVDPDRVLDKKEMAHYMGVSLRTIDNWINRRQIPHWRIGRNVRFRLCDVVRALNERNSVSAMPYWR